MTELKNTVAVSENGFIFDAETGNSFSANPLGVEIIQWLQKGKSNEEIKSEILLKYETDPDTADKDLIDFMGVLNHFQLVK